MYRLHTQVRVARVRDGTLQMSRQASTSPRRPCLHSPYRVAIALLRNLECRFRSSFGPRQATVFNQKSESIKVLSLGELVSGCTEVRGVGSLRRVPTSIL